MQYHWNQPFQPCPAAGHLLSCLSEIIVRHFYMSIYLCHCNCVCVVFACLCTCFCLCVCALKHQKPCWQLGLWPESLCQWEVEHLEKSCLFKFWNINLLFSPHSRFVEQSCRACRCLTACKVGWAKNIQWEGFLGNNHLRLFTVRPVMRLPMIMVIRNIMMIMMICTRTGKALPTPE